MTFNDILQKHREESSAAEARKALDALQEAAAKTASMKALIEQFNPVVKSVFDAFIDDANAANFFANHHFHEEEWRCWWSLQFIPAPNEGPDTSHITRNRNIASTLVRITAPSKITLEWDYDDANFKESDWERVQVVEVNEFTADSLTAWLDEFQGRMLRFRDEADRRRHSF